MERTSHGRAQRPEKLRLGVRILVGSLLLITIALPGVSLAEKLPWLLKARWIEVESASFSIKSTLKEKDATQLARDLELFRVVVHRMTGSDGGGAA